VSILNQLLPVAGLVLALATVSCRSGDPQRANPSGPTHPVQVLGHAGSGFFTPLSPFNPLPPSSMGGVLHALQQGADGVEIDIQLSQDSVPMLFHDVRLDGITTGKGCVSQHRAAALLKMRYRGGRPYDWFQHERPVTLDTLLRRLRSRPTLPILHLDLHESDACLPAGHAYDRVPTLVRQLARRFRSWPPDHLLVVSMQPTTLRQLRKALPKVPQGLEITSDFELGLQRALDEKVQAVVLDADKVTPEQAVQARAAGLQVVIFGGRSTGDIKRLLECHPDAIEVDNVGRLKAILNNRHIPTVGTRVAL
jgi:glycerophosphoryl diester phosphodiesterase